MHRAGSGVPGDPLQTKIEQGPQGCTNSDQWTRVASFWLPSRPQVVEGEAADAVDSSSSGQWQPIVPDNEVCVRRREEGIELIRGVSGGAPLMDCELKLQPLVLSDWEGVWDNTVSLLEQNVEGCFLFVCSKHFLKPLGGRVVSDKESGNVR
eukprot:gnl/TRDRNA2_/TRDRNA2_138452_c0_seq2.p1 gnl/TRDRNA2_/TRDRNA2_138452_c0~~gnl/TRDRNA2_/TRDRNA2_138452_c0_seq2.p1  ORF type:complete len:152 (+),score=24.14 gnl/TRDRNA2_/TRDRNA2_138452_c0_seq2:172-627(+)